MGTIVKAKDFDKKMRKLRTFNLILGAIHLFLGIFVLTQRDQISPFVNELPIYRTTTIISSDANSYNVGTEELKSRANLVNLIGTFFLITAFFHFLYASGANSWYKRMIEKGNNPLRWLEYSITATIMVVIISLAATVQEQNQLLLIIAGTVVIMLLGNVIERNIAEGNLWTAQFVTFLAWVLEGMIFWVIATSFIATIKNVNDALGKKGSETLIPSWVYALIIVQLIFYSLFGFVSLSETIRASTGKKINFLRYEVGYHILSVVSKMTLGLVFYFGAVSDKLGKACENEEDCEGRGSLQCLGKNQSTCAGSECTCQFVN